MTELPATPDPTEPPPPPNASHVRDTYVTPQMAKDWLAATAKAGDGFRNRRVDRAEVHRFRRKLREDRLDLITDELGISPEGWVINGQHRLHAILEEDKGAWLAVRYDLPKDTFARIDTGKPRNGATALFLDGQKNQNALAALAKLAYCWEHGSITFPTSALRDNDDLRAYVHEHPELTGVTERDPVPYGAKWAKSLAGVPQRFVALFAWALLGDESGFLPALVEDDGTAGEGERTAATLLRKTYEYRASHGEASDYRKTVGLFIKARNLWPDGPLPKGNLKMSDTEAYPRPLWSPPVPLGLETDDED